VQYFILLSEKPKNFGLISGRSKGFYSLQIILTCSRTHMASHFTYIGVSILGGKAFGRQADYLTDLMPIWKWVLTTHMSQSRAEENIYRIMVFSANLCLETLKSKMCFSGVFRRTLNISYTTRVEDNVLYLYNEVRFHLYNYLLFSGF